MTMMPLILSLVTAVFFLTLASLTYGSAVLITAGWVPMVVAVLIGTGATLTLLSRAH